MSIALSNKLTVNAGDKFELQQGGREVHISEPTVTLYADHAQIGCLSISRLAFEKLDKAWSEFLTKSHYQTLQ